VCVKLPSFSIILRQVLWFFCTRSLRRALYGAEIQRLICGQTQYFKKGKGKGRYSSLWETHLRATGRHLPYGITQCYLPPDTSERAPPNPSHAGWYSIYLPRRDGRLSWPSWLDSALAGSRTSDLSITSPTPNCCTTKTTSDLHEISQMLLIIILSFHNVLLLDDVDINECAVNNGGCGPFAVCTNTPGSFTCTSCTSSTGCNCTGKPKSDYNSVFLSKKTEARGYNFFSKRCETLKAWLLLYFYCVMRYSRLSVRPSVRLSVCDFGGWGPHWFKILETNCTVN